MMIQSQILQTLRAPESQARLAHIVAHEALNNRAAVGRRVCAEFGFVDARGSAQLAGCLKALNRLEGGGADCAAGAPAPWVRSLAAVSRRAGGGGHGGAGYGGSGRGVVAGAGRGTPAAPAVEYLAALRASAGHGDICRLPGALSGCFGARGARRGRVFGFGVAFAGARGVDGVERWAAPSPSAPGAVPEPVPDPPRRAMPQPGQPVLGQVLHRLPADFEVRYRYRPWLVETFVGLAHDGASFKAANFVWVGHTAGRGRQDRAHARAGTVKSVYMYELEPRWRRQLGLARVAAAPALAPGDGLDSGTSGRRTSLEGRRWATSVCRRVWSRARGCWQRCPDRPSPPMRPTTARR